MTAEKEKDKGMEKEIEKGMAMLVGSAIILIIFGLIFFLITLWIVKFTALDILDLDASGDWIVVSAAILSGAALIGSRHGG